MRVHSSPSPPQPVPHFLLPRSQPRGYALVCRHHEASGAEIVPGRHSARTRRRRHRARGRIFFLTCPRKNLWPCWCEMVSYPQNLQSVTLRMCRFFVCVCFSFSRNHWKDTDTHTRHTGKVGLHTRTLSLTCTTLSVRIHSLKHACTHFHTHRASPRTHTHTHTD